jgi:hypothetical protein
MWITKYEMWRHIFYDPCVAQDTTYYSSKYYRFVENICMYQRNNNDMEYNSWRFSKGALKHGIHSNCWDYVFPVTSCLCRSIRALCMQELLLARNELVIYSGPCVLFVCLTHGPGMSVASLYPHIPIWLSSHAQCTYTAFPTKPSRNS